jgi:glycosyltransferase involved in cell wall biosynthesis
MPSEQSPNTGGNAASTGACDSHGPRRIRLCIIATIGKSVQILYAGRLEYFMANGFEVTVVCASSELDDAIRARGVRLFTVPFTRAITPLQDLRAIVRLYRFLRREHFDLVEVSTPKAALLGSMAARLARSRPIVHVLHGLAYQGKRGLLGWILRASTRIPCTLSDVTLSVSPSVRDEACKDGIAARARICVLAEGSANGVDLGRFSPRQRALGAEVRHEYGIASDSVVIGFVGRMTRDKGIDQLAEVCHALSTDFPNVVLLVVGDYEHRDRPADSTVDFLSTSASVRHVGWQADVVSFMAAMDVLVLPTYREGFPTVLLEAAALGIPTVTTDATGACDASVDGKTGLQVPIGDVNSLREALARLVRDASLREAMGFAGRKWVCEHFDQRDVWRRYVEEYRAVVSDGTAPIRRRDRNRT